MTLQKMTDDELRQFVLGYCDNQIFTHTMVRNAVDVPMVFMSLALGGLPDDVDPNDVGVIWEWMREAGPRSCNGYPCFMSARLMHREDWDRAAKAINLELERRKDIVI